MHNDLQLEENYEVMENDMQQETNSKVIENDMQQETSNNQEVNLNPHAASTTITTTTTTYDMVVNGRPLKRMKRRVTADLYYFLTFPVVEGSGAME
ncbi:hypothetical protein LWI29_002323 [Acer saccharum]|uniref:Uncharacterized protein n=1 Tax=Acer saccharum TaxID=4024 RepID=A0AA39VMV6_ACESA|nr:hypothetical protein LWI29_002323 [Acer saccharum]